MILLKDLDFFYSEELVAQAPSRPSRVMWVDENPSEISIEELIKRIPAGDVLVLNDTRVLKRRVFAGDLEILFLQSNDQQTWDVLFPASRFKIGDTIELPLGVQAKVLEKGRPQKLQTSQPLNETYFEQVAEIPLPPYIQKARNERHTRNEDSLWYQTAWAEKPGSLASPTASLHFSHQDIEQLKKNGVQVVTVTLHVGLGTFLPVTTEILEEHKMHSEYVEITSKTWQSILDAKSRGHHIWALGTTTARALESAALGRLQNQKGFTDLLIVPSHKWQIVDRLLTNFHQPQSTLLALVAAFSDLEKVKSCYQWAIERKFRLFSYGDLSVWIR
jgi:S-adenosylmethionine:tRNA ribosyltransferase-isomerase